MKRRALVNWPSLGKAVLLVNGRDETELPARYGLLTRHGLNDGQLWALEKARGENAAIAELQTHCVVLDEAQRQGWRYLLLLDLPVADMHESTLATLFAELASLAQASDSLQSPLHCLPRMARLPHAGCVCFINACHYAVLRNALRRALEHGATLDNIWALLREKYGWPAFAVDADKEK